MRQQRLMELKPPTRTNSLPWIVRCGGSLFSFGLTRVAVHRHATRSQAPWSYNSCVSLLISQVFFAFGSRYGVGVSAAGARELGLRPVSFAASQSSNVNDPDSAQESGHLRKALGPVMLWGLGSRLRHLGGVLWLELGVTGRR